MSETGITSMSVEQATGASLPLAVDVTSKSGSPENPQKKRKYEEANPAEKADLYKYHLSNPHLKQRELAEWFKNKYGKPINQSTVSRILKKMKDGSTSFPGPLVNSEPIAKKRARKCPDPLTSINLAKSPAHVTIPGVLLPPTPPPRDPVPSKIHVPLLEFYEKTLLDCNSNAEEVRAALKQEARRLHAGIRPPPPPERIDEQIVDDAWISNWMRMYVRNQPPSPTSFNGYLSPQDASVRKINIDANRSSLAVLPTDDDRTSSDETEPRSPVSAFSCSEADSSRPEISPLNSLMTPNAGLSQAQLLRTPPSKRDAPENRRRKHMKKLRREIEKRDERIQKHLTLKNAAQRQLDELQKLDGAVLCQP